MQIQETFRQQIQPASFDALQRVLAYRNEDVIRRYMEDTGVSREDAERAFTAFLQFMAVSACRDERSTTTEEADGIWHVFLLHSKQYAAFCDEYLGGFVHHEPMGDDKSAAFYQDTRQSAEAMFGSLDLRMWPADTGRSARCFSGKDAKDRRFS